jgi:hypothetical protein
MPAGTVATLAIRGRLATWAPATLRSSPFPSDFVGDKSDPKSCRTPECLHPHLMRIRPSPGLTASKSLPRSAIARDLPVHERAGRAGLRQGRRAGTRRQEPARLPSRSGPRVLRGPAGLPSAEQLHHRIAGVRKNPPRVLSPKRRGVRKLIPQIPWYKDGIFSGVVELSFVLPETLPHFVRDSG